MAHTWKTLVAWVEGKYPYSWNNCITRFLRCSRTFLCPFSPEESLRPGVRGVLGEQSQFSKSVAGKTHKLVLRLPIMKSQYSNAYTSNRHLLTVRRWSWAQKTYPRPIFPISVRYLPKNRLRLCFLHLKWKRMLQSLGQTSQSRLREPRIQNSFSAGLRQPTTVTNTW